MAVTMSATGMARHVFWQTVCLEECNVLGNRAAGGFKNPHSGIGEFLQRTAANAPHYDCIHLMTTQTRYRVAGAMLMNLIAVVD